MPKFNFVNNCLHKTAVVPKAADPRQESRQGTTMHWVCHPVSTLPLAARAQNPALFRFTSVIMSLSQESEIVFVYPAE